MVKSVHLRRSLGVLFSGFLLAFQALSQTDSNLVVVEDGYIGKIKGKIATEISVNNLYEKFQVKTPNETLKLSPNTVANIRFKVSYRFITAAIQIAPAFIPGNNDDELKGKSKSFSIGTALVLKHLYVEGAYFKLKGYYLENTDDFISRNPSDPYIQFPDLYYQGYFLNFGWSSNAKFSYKSILTQTERQLKSAGSFLPIFEHSYYVISNKAQSPTAQTTKNLEFSIGPGYMYNLVLKRSFYVSLGAFATGGYLNTRLETRIGADYYYTTQDNFTYNWELRGGAGHNGKRFFSGVFARVSGSEYDQAHTTAHNSETRVYYHAFVGYRFTAPEFVRQQFDYVEERIPYMK